MRKHFSTIFIISFFILLFSGVVQADIIVTRFFASYGGYVYINGQPAPDGTIIDAYDPSGTHCGQGITSSDSTFKYFSVYGDDPGTTEDEGALSGEEISFKVNGQNITNVIVRSGSTSWSDQTVNVIELYTTAELDFELADFNHVLYGDATDTVWFGIAVHNTGTITDHYQLSGTSFEGWTTIDTNDNIYANPDETVILNLGVVIPLFPAILDTITFSIYSPTADKQIDGKVYVVQRVGGDVTNFEVVSYPSDTIADPGDNLNFDIRLKNIGNNTDSYSITTSSASGWTVTEDPIISLELSQEGNISFNIAVPIDFTALADTIDFTVFSNKNPDLNFSNSIIITIDEQQISTILTVTDEPGSIYVNPGETFRIFIGVKNDGTTSDLYHISSSSLLGWTTTDEDNVFNPSGNIEYVYFDVVVPLHVGTLYDTVTYTISSLIDPTQTFTGEVELISTSDIIVGLTVVEPAVNKSAFPGDTVAFSVEILNTGNSTDIYKMESVSGKNWVTIDDDDILNSPNDIEKVYFKVVVPDDLIDQFDVIDYTVSSKIDPSKFYSGTVVIKTSYNSIYVLTGVTEPIDQYGKVGTTSRFSFKIRNEGNSDDIYGIKANSSEGWNTTVLDSMSNPVGEVLKVNFDVDIPANGEGVIDNIFYRIFSYEDTTKFIEGYVNLTVSETEAFVLMESLTTPLNKSGFPSDTISFSFDVTNKGNSTDKYHFTSQSEFNWETINLDDFLIAPYDTQTVLFAVVIPTDAGDVEDHISFELSSLIDPAQSYSGNVILTCSKNPFVKMDIVQFPQDQAGAPGSTSRFTIEIQNGGNIEDIYGLTVSSVLGWSAIITLDSIINEPGQTVILSFDILVPDGVLNLVDEITYKVFSYIDPGVFYEDVVSLSVLTTDVDDDSKELLPDKFEVMQNYPNPFNPSTTIRFALPERSIVNIRIYNILGREVENINLGNISAGYHQIDYDGSNNASGIYFYKISSDFGNISKKMVLIK